VTTFRSITLVIAVLLLAGGALTGIHLLNTNATVPLPAQLSTPGADGRTDGPGTVAPVEQVPPAPAAPRTAAAPPVVAPAAAPAPVQRPTTTAADRSSGSQTDRASTSDRWNGGSGQWPNPEGFPRPDQYPFRDRPPGFGAFQAPGQAADRQSGQAGTTPTDRDRARQQIAYALCDRYHLPRERCQIEPSDR
jgi:hypothetical protein